MTTDKHPEEQLKRSHPTEKTRLHPRNRHRERYDFETLVKIYPPLEPLVSVNKYEDASIDFADPKAVKALNTALLMQYYDIIDWNIPEGYLCPPIPGRADYIHYAADLLSQCNFGKVPTGAHVRCLDIGIGANTIFPIIGTKEYGWAFIGSEMDEVALEAANKTIAANPSLKNAVKVRYQPRKYRVFKRVILDNEYFDLTICNPPFHGSAEEAYNSNHRKVKNLKLFKDTSSTLNFGGQHTELWCEGGEDAFVQQMIAESKEFGSQCLWFTTLVSKQSNLKRAYAALDRIGAKDIKTIPMGQGNKTSRLIAWTYMDIAQQKQWAKEKWQVS